MTDEKSVRDSGLRCGAWAEQITGDCWPLRVCDRCKAVHGKVKKP